jgi:cell division protein FtsZ
MGTGEASGEKRALAAAEAAISNPLIDDASMKGARGLLISITGGKDLTLYEVDEAATRIREEVDQDANIIVGATFDETLDGIIRVSVVATGIDQASLQQRPANAPEARLAELTQKLRTDQQRLTERVERSDTRVAMHPQPIQAPIQPTATSEGIESAAKAAVAAALQPITALEEVTIRPMQPKPSLFPEPVAEAPAEQPAPSSFIPPAPERAVSRAPRMPRIDELPLPAQNELRAKRGEPTGTEHPEKRRMGLLERLASVGLGGRREAAEEPQAPRPVVRPVARAAAPLPPRPVAARPMEPRAPDPVSEYARRPTHHQGLDSLGRQAPVHNSVEEDQLDIPAFLRRQAN